MKWSQCPVGQFHHSLTTQGSTKTEKQRLGVAFNMVWHWEEALTLNVFCCLTSQKLSLKCSLKRQFHHFSTLCSLSPKLNQCLPDNSAFLWSVIKKIRRKVLKNASLSHHRVEITVFKRKVISKTCNEFLTRGRIFYCSPCHLESHNVWKSLFLKCFTFWWCRWVERFYFIYFQTNYRNAPFSHM